MKRIRRPLNDGILPNFDAQRKKGKMGRPSKLTGVNLGKIESFCRWAGRPSYDSIALYIGIHKSTFQRWLNKYPDLRFQIECWKVQGLGEIRMKLGLTARKGNVTAIKYHLDRRDPDYLPSASLDVGIAPANFDADAPPPDYI